jgi:S-DNA-T family DNA segregation ATPase FtsK/SpoIIIE
MPTVDDNMRRDASPLRIPRTRPRPHPGLLAQRMVLDRSRLNLDILALCLFFLLVFVALSLLSYSPADPPSTLMWPQNEPVHNLCGAVGATVAYHALASYGAAVYVGLLGLVCLNVLLFARHQVSDPILRVLGWFLLINGGAAAAEKYAPRGFSGDVLGSGGYVGACLVGLAQMHFSNAGTHLLLAASIVFGLFLTIDYVLVRAICFVFRVLRWLLGKPFRLASRRRERIANAAPQPDDQTPVVSAPAVATVTTVRDDHVELTVNLPVQPQAVAELEEPAPADDDSNEIIPIRLPDDHVKLTPDTSARDADPDDEIDPSDVARHLDRASSGNGPDIAYELPPMELMEDPEPFPYEQHTESIRAKAKLLEDTIAEFGYRVKVVQIDTGPVVTQYEIELEAGLRVGKIHALADDLAIALKAPAVRIVAPLPNRDTVGVEVPNDQRASVRIKEVMLGVRNKTAKMKIPLFLGKDVKGNPLLYDLGDMPHLLIAGRTGTGKSVCLNSMILSILMTRRPDEVKMLMIDPKMVEMSQYRRIPHLMHPVVTDMKKAEAMLAWAVDKMEERYDILARAGVRHVSTYNQLGADEIYARLKPVDDQEKERIPTSMPYIVIIADEVADLMMTAPREVESHIIRLAQKSRAVGIHLIIATQKPTVDVITGLIKSNLPARIAFQVSSRSDSRVVLDEMGAEKLLGHGDMLFLVPGTSHLIRAQGTYASDKEINGVVQFLENYEPQYSRELVQLPTASGDKQGASATLRERDELYEQAIDIVVREGRGSVSLLQRAMGIGYGRAARLIDYMAEDGIVGDYNGSQARDVLYSPEEWEQMKREQKQAG